MFAIQNNKNKKKTKSIKNFKFNFTLLFVTQPTNIGPTTPGIEANIFVIPINVPIMI